MHVFVSVSPRVTSFLSIFILLHLPIADQEQAFPCAGWLEPTRIAPEPRPVAPPTHVYKV